MHVKINESDQGRLLPSAFFLTDLIQAAGDARGCTRVEGCISCAFKFWKGVKELDHDVLSNIRTVGKALK